LFFLLLGGYGLLTLTAYNSITTTALGAAITCIPVLHLLTKTRAQRDDYVQSFVRGSFLRCCRWPRGWTSIPRGTRAACRARMCCSPTACRRCWRSHHNCMSPTDYRRCLTPRRRLSRGRRDPPHTITRSTSNGNYYCYYYSSLTHSRLRP